MTWWYRWLCRLSGVLGAVCEYPARGRGRPGRPPRMRVRPRPSGAPPRGGAGWARGEALRARAGRTPGGCYGYRPGSPRPGGSGEVSGGTVRSRGRVAAPRRVAARGPAASAPGGGFRDLPGAARGAPAQPGPEAASPVDLGVGGAAAVFPFGRGLWIRGARGARAQGVPEGGSGREPRGRGLSSGCSLSIRRPARALCGRWASAAPRLSVPPAPSPTHRKADCYRGEIKILRRVFRAQMCVQCLNVVPPLLCLGASLWGLLEERAPSPGLNQCPPGTAGWGRADPDRVCQ